MIIHFGKGPYGKVEELGSSFVFTNFFHVWRVPLVPLESYLVCAKDGPVLPIPMHRGSVIAAYLRLPLFVAGAAALIGGFGESSVPAVILGMVLLVLFTVAKVRWGKLDAATKSRRQLTARHLDFPGDPAMLLTPEHERSLHALLHERTAVVAARSYRGSTGDSGSWQELAIDPAVTDEAYLTAALTLADATLPAARTEDERKLLREVGAAAWSKLAGASRPVIASRATPTR